MKGITKALNTIPKRYKGIISDYYREYNKYNYDVYFSYTPRTKDLSHLDTYYSEFKRYLISSGPPRVSVIEAIGEDNQ